MKKSIIQLSIFFLCLSISLQTMKALGKETINLEYEYINIKDMAETEVALKQEKTTSSLESLLIKENILIKSNNHEFGALTETSLGQRKNSREEVITSSGPLPVWHLPTEMGVVTQNPSYYHPALDITSPRGSNEIIFPVANGVISSIYTDSAGALIVTVLHNIDGVKYTSQYAHFSSYAEGLYVGKAVTINDALGRMGTTGWSTGVHLHLAVVDCALFDPNDTRCSDLNHFNQYARYKVSNGYWGLGSYIIVPGSWNSRF